MSLKPKVALSQDFLFQLAKLPSNVHSKVLKWAVIFQTDPKSPGINYEKIHAARDLDQALSRMDDEQRALFTLLVEHQDVPSACEVSSVSSATFYRRVTDLQMHLRMFGIKVAA